MFIFEHLCSYFFRNDITLIIRLICYSFIIKKLDPYIFVFLSFWYKI
jgi:hypothetical protein